MSELLQRCVREFQLNRKKRHWAITAVSVLSLFVACGVFWQLRIVGITMTDEACCGKTEHQHTKACMTERKLICGKEEGQPEGEPVLVCAIPEHEHTEVCYEIQPVLICAQQEHQHTEACYKTEKILVCTEDHEHTDACYEEQSVLVCEQPEHVHADECYEKQKVLICEEQEHVHAEGCWQQPIGHVHTDACYEDACGCGLEEHTHSILCYSDPNADVEGEAEWMATLPKQLPDNWAEALVSVANSQVGYGESSRNFELAQDGETEKGYTRYGAWYGNPYGDWNTMFVSFCLHYAGIPEDAIPQNSGAFALQSQILEKAPISAEAAPLQPGDVVFFADDPASTQVNHTAIVSAVNGEDVTVIMGDIENAVQIITRKAEEVKGSVSTQAAYAAAVAEQSQTVQQQLAEQLAAFDAKGLELNNLLEDAIEGEITPEMTALKLQMDEIYAQALALYLQQNPEADEMSFTADLAANHMTAWMAYCDASDRADKQLLKEKLEQFDQKGAELEEMLRAEPKNLEQIKTVVADLETLQAELLQLYQKAYPDKTPDDFAAMLNGEHAPAVKAYEAAKELLAQPQYTDPIAGELQADMMPFENEEVTVKVSLKGSVSFPVLSNDPVQPETEAPPAAVAKSPWEDIAVKVTTLDDMTEEYLELSQLLMDTLSAQAEPEELKAMSLFDVAFEYFGQPLDVSGCSVEVEVTPKDAFFEFPQVVSLAETADAETLPEEYETILSIWQKDEAGQMQNLNTALLESSSADAQTAGTESASPDQQTGTKPALRAAVDPLKPVAYAASLRKVGPGESGKMPGTVQGVDTASKGVKISLFDYPDGVFRIGDFEFNDGGGLGEGLNHWTGNSEPRTGIVRDRLVNGYPVRTGGRYTSLGPLFGAGGGKIQVQEYSGLNYLFQKNADGRYWYDGDVNFATINPSGNKYGSYERNFTLYEEPTRYYNLESKDKWVRFLPFNKYDVGTLHRKENPKGFYKEIHNGDVNFHFGMSIEIPFVMPPDGNITKANGTVDNMTFHFKGDDDVWVFLDDQLVMDIGGLHDSADGMVDFNTGDVTVEGSRQANMWTDVFGAKFQDYSHHTLKFFYLERGRNASNCAIDFNLPMDANGALWVEKELDKVAPKQNEAFTFDVKLNVPNGKTLGNATYAVYESFMDYDAKKDVRPLQEEQKLQVDQNNVASFQLKHGQFAVLRYLPSGTSYTVTEREGDFPYTTNIKAGEIYNENGGTIWEEGTTLAKEHSDFIKIENTDRIRFVNSVTYELPSTGGVGARMFGIAGAVLLLISLAGVWHNTAKRKKEVDHPEV